MNIGDDKKSRAALKTYFVKNAIPTEGQFAQLIDSALNQRDDGLAKAAGDPLSVEAAGDATSLRKTLNLYGSFADPDPAFTIALRPRADVGNPGSGRPGFAILDGAGNARLCVSGETGRVGIGANIVAPDEALEVGGRIKAGPLTAGPWPADERYACFASNTLDQRVNRNYAVLQEAGSGRTYLNSPADIRFRINNADRMVLTSAGQLGIGTSGPNRLLHVENSEVHTGGSGGGYSFANREAPGFVENGANGQRWVLYATGNSARLWAGGDRLLVSPTGDLTVTGAIRAGALATGPWPANPSVYAYFGHSALDHAQAGNYALLQGGDGQTFLNSPRVTHFRIGNAQKMTLTDSALSVDVPVFAAGSDIYFSDTRHRHSGTGNNSGYAAIENDGGSYNALMILGRTVSQSPLRRVVKLWDELTVHGPLVISQGHVIKIGVPRSPYANDGIRGEPNLWLDAAGTVIIKQGFQSRGMDVAERFPAAGFVEAGDVVVFDEAAGAVRRCAATGDARAVGIVSDDAAFILGMDQADVPVALCGRVWCRADAEGLPIRSGDLLTTSAAEGHARRAEDPAACPGAIIGKALTSLDGGRGKVLVLVHSR